MMNSHLFYFLTHLITSKMKVNLKRLLNRTYTNQNKQKCKSQKLRRTTKNKNQRKDSNQPAIHNRIKQIYHLQVQTILKQLSLKSQFRLQILSCHSIWKVCKKILTSEIFLNDIQDGFCFVELIIDHLQDVTTGFMLLILLSQIQREIK